MRVRTVLLILCIVLVAAFVALNLGEFTEPSLLSLGFTTVEAPLGMVMLILLAAVLLVFLAVGIYMQSTFLLESRNTARELHAQRELADRAEASRFTELRLYLEEQNREANGRETTHARMSAERLAEMQQSLHAKIEQTGNTLAAYIGELEDRLERSNPQGNSTPQQLNRPPGY